MNPSVFAQTHNRAVAESRSRVEALRASLQAAQPEPVRLIETHLSWVLLTHEWAYKFKKPLALPFVDFSTLAARQQSCEEELRLNRRLAPQLYAQVVQVHAGPVLGGAGPVLDVAVQLRRFDDGALWSEQLAAGSLRPEHVDQLALRLARFHQAAAIATEADDFGSAATHRRVMARLIDAMDGWHSQQTTSPWPDLRDWLTAQLQTLTPCFEQRRRAGRVREGHGDLHLGNLLVLGEEVTAFDGIEFDPALRWVDVLNDIAFCVMDLKAHGAHALAYRFLNAYLEASGDYGGVPLVRFYLVARALVRAQVAAISEAQGLAPANGLSARHYLREAREWVEAGPARLAITHGLPGSGKSFASQAWLEAAGAIRVRSDVERKRLFGLEPLASSKALVPGGIYDESSTARTYQRLLEVARLALRAHWPVVVDAAFLAARERADFAALATELSVAFSIIDCQADKPVLLARLAQRQASGRDASEADAQVLERLQRVAEPLSADEQRVCVRVDSKHSWLQALGAKWPA